MPASILSPAETVQLAPLARSLVPPRTDRSAESASLGRSGGASTVVLRAALVITEIQSISLSLSPSLWLDLQATQVAVERLIVLHGRQT